MGELQRGGVFQIERGVQRVLTNKPIPGKFAGKGAGFLGPPALVRSWRKIHRSIDSKYHKLKPGEYKINEIKYNVKPYSLLSDRGIAIEKYQGYDEDLRKMKINNWNTEIPINFNF